MYKIFVDGKDGTTGLRIYEYLKDREDIEILTIDEAKRKDIDEKLKMMRQSDLTILCLPDEAAREAALLAPKDVRILDASSAHRVDPDWVYGMPELGKTQREKIQSAQKTAVPGCHATGFILLVRPLIEKGFIGADYPFACHSITGYSGGGKKMIMEYENPDRTFEYSSPRQYGLAQKHKHLPEIMAITGINHEPAFNPIVCDFPCGMTVSVPIAHRLLEKAACADELRQLYRSYYESAPMIDVMSTAGPASGFLSANEFAGKNTLQIVVYGNNENIMLAARYDNLGKGASGGAVQCLNLMLGMQEEKGLLD